MGLNAEQNKVIMLERTVSAPHVKTNMSARTLEA